MMETMVMVRRSCCEIYFIFLLNCCSVEPRGIHTFTGHCDDVCVPVPVLCVSLANTKAVGLNIALHQFQYNSHRMMKYIEYSDVRRANLLILGIR